MVDLNYYSPTKIVLTFLISPFLRFSWLVSEGMIHARNNARTEERKINFGRKQKPQAKSEISTYAVVYLYNRGVDLSWC
jgi:hypothetical protein